MESLSAYARQFLEMMDKPDVDLIEGLSPAISIEQKTTSKNPRSTVGTVTEIYDYLRTALCPSRDPSLLGMRPSHKLHDDSADGGSDYDAACGTRIHLLAPIVSGREGDTIKTYSISRVKVSCA